MPLEVIKYMANIAKGALTTTTIWKQVPCSTDEETSAFLTEFGGVDYQNLLEEAKHIAIPLIGLLLAGRIEEAVKRLDDGKQVVYADNDDGNGDGDGDADNDDNNNNGNGTNIKSGGLNVLMASIWLFANQASTLHQHRIQVLIRKLVKVGGKELVLMTNDTNSNSVHYASFNRTPLEIGELVVATCQFFISVFVLLCILLCTSLLFSCFCITLNTILLF